MDPLIAAPSAVDTPEPRLEIATSSDAWPVTAPMNVVAVTLVSPASVVCVVPSGTLVDPRVNEEFSKPAFGKPVALVRARLLGVPTRAVE